MLANGVSEPSELVTSLRALFAHVEQGGVAGEEIFFHQFVVYEALGMQQRQQDLLELLTLLMDKLGDLKSALSKTMDCKIHFSPFVCCHTKCGFRATKSHVPDTRTVWLLPYKKQKMNCGEQLYRTIRKGDVVQCPECKCPGPRKVEKVEFATWLVVGMHRLEKQTERQGK